MLQVEHISKHSNCPKCKGDVRYDNYGYAFCIDNQCGWVEPRDPGGE